MRLQIPAFFLWLTCRTDAGKIVWGHYCAEDPAEIFLDVKHRQSLRELGIRLRVLRAVRILALCINPIRQGLNRGADCGNIEGLLGAFQNAGLGCCGRVLH